MVVSRLRLGDTEVAAPVQVTVVCSDAGAFFILFQNTLSRKGKVKGRTLIGFCLGPNTATMTGYYPLNNGKTDAGSLILIGAMEPLENPKSLSASAMLKPTPLSFI